MVLEEVGYYPKLVYSPSTDVGPIGYGVDIDAKEI